MKKNESLDFLSILANSGQNIDFWNTFAQQIKRWRMTMKVKVVMKVVVMVAMKVVDEVSDENGEWLILSCLTGFEMDKRTEICDCRVTFMTGKEQVSLKHIKKKIWILGVQLLFSLRKHLHDHQEKCQQYSLTYYYFFIFFSEDYADIFSSHIFLFSNQIYPHN